MTHISYKVSYLMQPTLKKWDYTGNPWRSLPRVRCRREPIAIFGTRSKAGFPKPHPFKRTTSNVPERTVNAYRSDYRGVVGE